MRILLIAPQPFFQERGTPIAVELLLKALSEQGHQIDLLVFNEGQDREYPNTTIHRVFSLPKLSGIKPGFSLKKLYLDLWLLFAFIKLQIKNRYQVVHAVEESVFFAMLLRPIFGYRYINDIDSSMTTQLIDKFSAVKLLEKPLRWLESLPMRFADAVVPMCDALADEASKYRDNNIFVLKDIDLSKSPASIEFAQQQQEDCRAKFTQPDLPLFMYIGNLESYQGIDLLVDSFAKLFSKLSTKPGAASATQKKANLLIIGGEQNDIDNYQQKCAELGLSQHIIFAGKRPVDGLGYYMQQADFLVSPRTQGVNTPMKVYSYLGSGKAVLATNLPTHTQVMTAETAVLAEPNSDDFSQTMLAMCLQPENYQATAQKAAEFIQREHSFEAFKQQLKRVYDCLPK